MKLYEITYGLQNNKYTCYTIANSPEEGRRQIEKELGKRGVKSSIHGYSCNDKYTVHLLSDDVKKQIVYNSPYIVDEYNDLKSENKMENEELNKSIYKKKKERAEQEKIPFFHGNENNKSTIEQDKQTFFNQLKGKK